MRKSPFVLALLLAACGGNGVGPPPDNGTGSVPAQHVPEIGNIKLSPNNVVYMAGDGEVLVSVEFAFSDAGQDIQTLLIDMPDGTRLERDATSSSAAGTITESVTISTKTVGAFPIQIGLVDKAGDSSNQLLANFEVFADVPVTQWVSRLSGLPFILNDVVWSGTKFIAVGDGGKISTSTDGIDWVTQEGPACSSLVAVASQGPEIVAVGADATVLLSTDDGATWTVKHAGDRVRLAGVAIRLSQIVAGGMDLDTGDAFVMRSTDGGATWGRVESWPRADHFVTDLVDADGLFVAATDAFNNSTSGARVMVSTDGALWHEVVVSGAMDALHAVWHFGNQFVASGVDSTLVASPDGYNWSTLQTPVKDVDYLSAAWDGSRLVVAGGITWWYWWFGAPSFERPDGLASADGGVTWEMFNIDAYYQSRGMAWGNGRFVSVGQSTPDSGEGAIYTSN